MRKSPVARGNRSLPEWATGAEQAAGPGLTDPRTIVKRVKAVVIVSHDTRLKEIAGP